MQQNQKINAEKIKKAKEYATKMHFGQTRKDGLTPYIVHPLAVAENLYNRGFGDDYIITALFHDLLEDTSATESDIEQIGGKNVLQAVKLLTKKQGYIMKEYVEAIKQNPIAYAVKGADRLNNIESAGNTPDDFKRRYIEETKLWYLDFVPEMRAAVCELEKTLK